MRACVWLVAAAAALAADDLAPETLLLARIKTKTGENLRRLPNYTCLQTVERSLRRVPSRKFELLDMLRLEVALVGGKELYSWPGAGRFEDRKLSDLVQSGATGEGAFALHARSVFLSNGPTFTYAGPRERDGRKTERYDYRVPQMLSGFTLRVAGRQAIVGYHGSFWADAATLDLLRLEVIADDIPPHLQLASASNFMEYGRMRIGEADFLLPVSSELTMTDLTGNESRNLTRFDSCRQYAGESFLSFAEPPPVESAAPPPVVLAPIQLPAGLLLEVKLESAIDLRKAAIGDPVVATVNRDVKRNKETLVPKGAQVTGRIERMEKWRTGGRFWLVALRFSAIEFDRRQGDFHATLDSAGPMYTSGPRLSRDLYLALERSEPSLKSETSPSGFYLPASQPMLPKGFRTTWKTEITVDNGETK